MQQQPQQQFSPQQQMPYAAAAVPSYDFKHGSYATSGYPSGMPNSPLPPGMFQGGSPQPGQQLYAPAQNYSPHGSPVNPQAWYPPGQQQGSPQPMQELPGS
jgi:hypothetical protein